jgi:hypothetical protein
MSRNRKRKAEPGDVYWSDEQGCLVRFTDDGEEEPWEPGQGRIDPYAGVREGRDPTPEELDAFLHAHDPRPDEDDSRDLPRRADHTIAPFYSLSQDELEKWGQDTPRNRRVRHDGWTVERQKDFIERLAASASVTDAARYVGMSRQSARDLYNRSPQFRAAWDEAVRASVSVLAETAFDRAVNGVQEQVWYKGRMVGFREKHDTRLLMFLLRVRDPLNFAPLGDLQGWQRYRALDDRSHGVAPTLDRLEAAEKAWAEANEEPPALPVPADRLEAPASPFAEHVAQPADRTIPNPAADARPAPAADPEGGQNTPSE